MDRVSSSLIPASEATCRGERRSALRGERRLARGGGFRLVLAVGGLMAAGLSGWGGGAGAPVTLAWDANSETDLAGYRVYVGQESGKRTTSFEAGRATTITLENLTAGATYYVSVTAYNTTGLESLPSEEVSFTVLSVAAPLVLEPLTAPPAGDPALTASTPTITQGGVLGSGGYGFVITATPGRRLAVYASDDMVNWELLATSDNPTGRLQATDAAAAEEVGRYYQVVPQ